MSGRQSGRNRPDRSATASSSRSARSPRGRASRLTRTVTYAEDSDSFEDDSSAAENTSTPSRHKPTSRRQRSTTDASPRPRKKRETVKMAIGQPRLANTSKSARLPSGLPPWPEPAKLPYDILLSIFQYAAYPLRNTPGAAWLVKMALLRRDFLEPAMSALYYSPPLEPASRAHSLFEALTAQTESSLIDYRRKVRSLDIDVPPILIYKCAGKDPLSLTEIVALTPMLRNLVLNWPNDDPAAPEFGPPNIPASKVSRWYGRKFTDLLDQNDIKMSHWKWNYILAPTLDYPWIHMTEIHQRACFKDLKSVEICRLGHKLGRLSKYMQLIESLSSALGELKQLESVTMSNPQGLLPSDITLIFKNTRPLTSISFLYCDDLTSECVRDVLANSGSALRHLTLNHNSSLDVSFLTELGVLSPHLQTLIMDLTLYSTLGSVRSAEPRFTVLLPDGCTPQWPRTLQHLQLVHLRKWHTQAAYTFLASLVEAAPEMRSMRYLGIRMSVDADWRDRIKFRDVWEERIVRVFQRRTAPPHRWTGGLERADRGRSSAPSEGAGNGTCDRVDVRIENLRPMDKLLKESDFLDAEKEGDGMYGR